MNVKAKRITTIAMLCALAYVVMGSSAACRSCSF